MHYTNGTEHKKSYVSHLVDGSTLNAEWNAKSIMFIWIGVCAFQLFRIFRIHLHDRHSVPLQVTPIHHSSLSHTNAYVALCYVIWYGARYSLYCSDAPSTDEERKWFEWSSNRNWKPKAESHKQKAKSWSENLVEWVEQV